MYYLAQDPLLNNYMALQKVCLSLCVLLFCSLQVGNKKQILIGQLSVDTKTNWDSLDDVIRKQFKVTAQRAQSFTLNDRCIG